MTMIVHSPDFIMTTAALACGTVAMADATTSKAVAATFFRLFILNISIYGRVVIDLKNV